MVAESLQAWGEIVARETLVVSGMAVVEHVFAALSQAIVCERRVSDGERVKPGEVVMAVHGSAASILTGERVALNLLQRLSGVASLTRQYVDLVAGTAVQILDTRKTTPGMRWLEKQAVLHGGGVNHRAGLFDAVLIKDNHLAALAGAGVDPIEFAVGRARERWPGLSVEVEADSLDQAKAAVEAGADVVLLDNMSLDTMRSAVQWIHGRAKTEASGGVSLETVRAIAETGVDRISVGALTHSARAVDLALDLRLATKTNDSV
jgi:nicotinate-nucleotide pyrophosphorylase (carboxylating)